MDGQVLHSKEHAFLQRVCQRNSPVTEDDGIIQYKCKLYFFDGQLWRVEMFDMTQIMMQTMSRELNVHLVLKVVLVMKDL